MTRKQIKSSRTKVSDPRELARFIEELSWLLKSFDNLDYNALSKFSDENTCLLFSRKNSRAQRGGEDKTMILVGVLPNFLMDPALFPSNEGIVEFSDAALGLPIKWWKKKSKYEIIGHIVCNANKASPAKVQRLSDLIEEMLDQKTDMRRNIEANREQGHTWSEVIGKLYNEF